jgi:hypothetical protein
VNGLRRKFGFLGQAKMLPGIAVCRNDSYWRSDDGKAIVVAQGANGPTQTCARTDVEQLVALIFVNILSWRLPLAAVAGGVTP